MPQPRTHSEPIRSNSAGLLRGAVGCRAVRCRREGLLLHENWHTSDDETLNEPCAQKPLNRDSTVDVQVVRATSSELRHDLSITRVPVLMEKESLSSTPYRAT